MDRKWIENGGQMEGKASNLRTFTFKRWELTTRNVA